MKSFQLRVEDFQITLAEFQEDHFNTKIRAVYKTDSIATLPDYAVVQFVKGCRFESKVENGNVEKKIAWGSITSFNKLVSYYFPTWTLDSMDSNPIYNSDDKPGRVDTPHYL